MAYQVPMPRRPKQLEFQGKEFFKPKAEFGGGLLKGNSAKSKRPLDSRKPLHLSIRARQGGMLSPKVAGSIDRIITTAAKRNGVRIYSYSNVGNHIHFVIRIMDRKRWCAFIRELTGRIALAMKQLNLAKKGQSFWLQAPFTRIIAGWGHAYRVIKDYVYLNHLEAEGIISRRETKTLKDYKLIFSEA